MGVIEIFGFIGAVLIGVALGLIGGGGSILTVPVFVYLLHIDPVLATAYSLFVVGLSALVGAIRNYSKGLLDIKTGIVFAIPAFIAVYLTRRLLIPALPEEIITIHNLIITKQIGIMVFFAIVMVVAAVSMIKDKNVENNGEEENLPKFNLPLIILEGVVVGTITGIVGAGGGFLIVPALVLLGKLPMKMAVGTSLMIIAIKSLIGFLGDLGAEQPIDWQFLAMFSALSIGGIFIGGYLSNFIDGERLKKGFGWFVLIMGVYIILNETVLAS